MVERNRLDSLLHIAVLGAAANSLLSGCAGVIGLTPVPGVTRSAPEGVFVTYEFFPSRHVAARKVVIWLPADYAQSNEPHAVLYMHDGQNLFYPATSMAGQPWAVDMIVGRLLCEGSIRRTLVVGIANTADRNREYTPAKPLAAMPPEMRRLAIGGGGEIISEAYLRFLVTELKPFIDANFRTLPGRDDTCVMGSSRGGLISLYALARYPHVFGGAACLSTHWTITTDYSVLFPPGDARVNALAQSYLDWLAIHLPRAGSHRLYFDHGSKNLDSLYAPFQAKADRILEHKGYRQDVDWMTRIFPGADHNEPAWRERLHIPLQFLMAR
ncbi:MAG: alpha/beta hydrolase-fold protein [Betaproteobacteria bacterium]